MEQDPTLNNLEHAPGYTTAELGTLGGVTRMGSGPQAMVLIAGAGFGAEIFQGFMEINQNRFKMLAVTLAGFGGTPAPPMPAPGTSYAEQTWTRAAAEGVVRLIESEGLDRPAVVGHWLNGTQVALEVAARRPDLVKAAVILSGVSKFVPTGAGMAELKTPEMRAMMIDQYMAPQWFRTVTRETWDDNNFLPRDYAIHPLRALQLWKEAARPTLPVWIRYLCEVWAHDSTLDLEQLQVPLLIVQPEFDDLYRQGPQPGGGYMETILHESWVGVESDERITVKSVPDSRVFLMDDQLEKLDEIIIRFLDKLQPTLAPPNATAGRPDLHPAVSRMPSPPGLGYWNGDARRDGERHVLAGGAVSLELPDPSWKLEALADAAPVIAHIRGASPDASITLQIQPLFASALGRLPQMLEAELRNNYEEYEVLAHGKLSMNGTEAIEFVGTYLHDGDKMRIRVILARLGAEYLFSASFRAPDAQFGNLTSAFDEIERSLLLEAN
jgi:pimeloyl-ACP methyl ester carboxylesterase